MTQAPNASKNNAVFERIYRFLFGNDIFVSYARHDAEDYALSLTSRLTKANYLCYLDQLGTRPGGKLPPELLSTLRRSTVFVLIGTEAAIASNSIEDEITEFLKTSRPIIPIDFNGALEKAQWYPLIKGIALKRVISEQADPSKRPSASTVRRIGDSFNYTRRNQWLRILLLAAIFIFASTVLGSGAIVASAKWSAWNTEIDAALLTLSARISAAAANHDRENAESLTALANSQREKAQLDASIASAKAIVETQKANQAEQRKQAALEEANKQEKIATAHQLANRASETLKHRANLLPRSVLYAVEAMRRLDDLGVRSLDADSALREGLGLLPTLERSFEIKARGFEKITITRDGRYLAAETLNGAILTDLTNNRTFDFPISRNLHLLNTYTPFVFSSDGKYLVILEDDLLNQKSITHIISTASGKPIRPPVEYPKRVNALALSSDGEHLAVAVDNTIQVIETITGKSVGPTLVASGEVTKMTFSPEKSNSYLASATNGEVRIWAARNATEPVTLKQPGETVSNIAFNENGKYLAIVTSKDPNKSVRVWDWQANHTQPVVPAVQYPTVFNVDLCFSPDGKHLAISSGDDSVRILDLENGNTQTVTHRGFVSTMAFNASGRQLVTAGGENTARIWDITTGQEIARFYHDADLDHEFSVRAVAFHSDGNQLMTVSSDHTVRIWGVTAGQPVTRTEHKDMLDAMVFSPDGLYFATAENNPFTKGVAVVWDAKTDREISRIDTHTRVLNTIAFDPTGQYLITGSADRSLCVWDQWNVGPQPRKVVCHYFSAPVQAVAFSSNGQYLAVARREKTLLILENWNTGSLRTVAVISHPDQVSSVVFSPDKRFIASGCRDGFARIWQWQTAADKPLAAMKHGPIVKAMAFSVDGHYLATAGFRREAYVWNWRANTNEPAAILQHESDVWSVAFDVSGRYLATSSSDYTTRIWAKWTGPYPFEITRISGRAGVTGVTFSPTGEYLGTINSNHNAEVWLWQPRDLIRQACDRLKRNMTKEEWKANLYGESYRRTCENLPPP